MAALVGQRQHIGPVIRQLRQQRGLSLDELADLAALSASHLSRLERGMTRPSFVLLGALAHALDIPLERFVRLEDEIAELNSALRQQLTAQGLDQAIIQEVLRLSVDTRRQLHAIYQQGSSGS